MNASKRVIEFFSMIFAIALVMGTQTHAGVQTHEPALTLEWKATTDGAIGYYIYYGETPDPARMQMLPNVPALDGTPSVRVSVLRDLGALPGERVCFRVKAYDRVSVSALSPPVCSIV